MEQHSGFNVVDLSVLVVLLLSGGLAFWRGLVREVFSLGAWVGASFAAVTLYPVAKPWVHSHIKSEMGSDAATALGLFCLAMIILIPIGNLLSGMVKGKTLTAIDRSLGLVFGFVRGLLVMSLLYLAATWVFLDKKEDTLPDWLAEARTEPVLAFGADLVKELMPQDEQDKAAAAMRKKRDQGIDAVEAAEQLERLSTPTPAVKGGDAPAYEDDARTKMNDLVEKKGRP